LQQIDQRLDQGAGQYYPVCQRGTRDIHADKPQGGMAVDPLHGGQCPLSSTLELTPGVLTLTTNSMQRA